MPFPAEVPTQVHDLAIYAGLFLTLGGVLTLVTRGAVRGIEVVLERQLHPFAQKVETITDELTLNGGESMKDVVLEVRTNQEAIGRRFGAIEHRQAAMLRHFGLDEGLVPRADGGP